MSDRYFNKSRIAGLGSSVALSSLPRYILQRYPEGSHLQGLAPPKLCPSHHVVSAMLPPSGVDMSNESFEGPDVSSPAQAYMKRQWQTGTICHPSRDGTEDFGLLTVLSLQ